MAAKKSTRTDTPAMRTEARAVLLVMENLNRLLLRWKPGWVPGLILEQHIEAAAQALMADPKALAAPRSDDRPAGGREQPRIMAALLRGLERPE